MLEIVICVLVAMRSWVPPAAPRDDVRYVAIARDIAEVAREAPVFDGPSGDLETAVLMAAIASIESSYRDDVDRLEARGRLGEVGIMQVLLRRGERCWDRRTCLEIGRERVRESLAACRRLAERERLAVYASGSCGRGRAAARARWDRYAAWIRRRRGVE